MPDDFDQLKTDFLNKIKHFTTAYDIHNEMIVNWDKTGVKFVPQSEWTMATKGSNQVPVFGLEDKREMTVLLTVTPTGKLLPPHLIYAGKTNRCHSKVMFPEKWHITHSESN